MRLTLTALNVQLIPRGILRYGGNMPRTYRYVSRNTRRLSCAGGLLLGKCLSPSFHGDALKLPGPRQNAVRVASSSSSSSDFTSDGFPRNLTKQKAKELATRLTSEERSLLLNAINERKSEEEKAGFQEQLAAFRWRSKFGRPSKLPSLGDVDPTGTYCPVPEDWLLRKYVQNVPELTTSQLILVAVSNAIPFIGFGFLDNFIMIVAGDQIELALSSRFPVSTMAAAALGNTVSDIIGIGSVHYVEMFAQKIGFKPPKLNPMQLNLPKTRLAANVGRVVGVTVGCLLGMIPIPIFSFLHNGS